MMRLTLAQIQRKAETRPTGYVEDVLSHGVLENGILTLTADAYAKLKSKYHRIEQKLVEPSKLELAGRFGSALFHWAKAGFPLVSQQEYERRMEICSKCPLWDGAARKGLGKCNSSKCGCTRLKQFLATQSCPEGNW